MADSRNKQNKNEAIGQFLFDETLLTAAADIWDCVCPFVATNKSRVFACVPVCCQTQALDCVCLECFPLAPWLREMICFTEFGLHVLPTLCVVMFLSGFT